MDRAGAGEGRGEALIDLIGFWIYGLSLEISGWVICIDWFRLFCVSRLVTVVTCMATASNWAFATRDRPRLKLQYKSSKLPRIFSLVGKTS